MNGLPDGYVLDQPQQAGGLPPGYVIDAASPQQNDGNNTSYNPNSFAQNPSWGNFGNAVLNAAKDTAMSVPDSMANIGQMVYGSDEPGALIGPSKPIIADDATETASNLLNLGMPFMATPSGKTAGISPEEYNSDIRPTSGDLQLIKDKLTLAGITPQQYADALLKSSPDDFAGELGGDPLRIQTQAQAKIMGPSMQAARDAMRQRLDTAPQRVQQLIERTFYPSSGIEPTVGGDVALQAGAAASNIEPVQQAQLNLSDIGAKLPDLYSAAENSTVPRKPFLDIINTPNGQTAMQNTVTRLANQNISPEEAGIIIDPKTGFHGLQTQGVPVSTMQEVGKSLGDLVKRNPMTGAIEDADSLTAEGQRQKITSYLSQNSPEFNAANTNAAAQFQGQNAFEAGRKLAHAAAGEKADELAQRAADVFSPQELSYQKAGYVQGLGDALQGSPLGGGNPAARIAKGTVQNTTADILQSPTQAQQFADALMQEKNRVDLAQRGLFGSNTAETLEADKGGELKIPTSNQEMAMVAAKKVGNIFTRGMNQARNDRIANLLYATSPEQKAIIAQRILQ